MNVYKLAFLVVLLQFVSGCSRRESKQSNGYITAAFKEYQSSNLGQSSNIQDYHIEETVHREVIIVDIYPSQSTLHQFGGNSLGKGYDAKFYFDRRSGKIIKKSIGA